MGQLEKLGRPVPHFVPPSRPSAEVMTGRFAHLELLDAERHASDLHRANTQSDAIWDYLPYGPFASAAGYHRWVRDVTAGQDPVFYAIQDRQTGHWAGIASYLRVTPEAGSIEIGHINFAPELQRTAAATEAVYLMMRWAFEAGYRRFEWKCNALNLGSRRAAERFGFSYEGVFRQAGVVKGYNRDTAWFAAIDAEWPALKEAFESWLSPENFDARGRQKESLSDLTALVRVSRDPALTP